MKNLTNRVENLLNDLVAVLDKHGAQLIAGDDAEQAARAWESFGAPRIEIGFEDDLKGEHDFEIFQIDDRDWY